MISVDFFGGRSCPIGKAQAEKIVKIASSKEKKIDGLLEISIVTESKIKEINKKFRGKNKVTDVLSFSWLEGVRVPGVILGELYLCYPQIMRQARELGIPPREEFVRMLVHGLLHIVGYDHVKSGDSKKMFALQENIVELVKKRRII